MDPVVIVAGLILLGISVYLVGVPLLKPLAEETKTAKPAVSTVNTEEAKEIIFATLAEIEFDYQMGKLAEEDYLKLKGEYQPRAIQVLRSQAKAKGDSPQFVKDRAAIEAELEKELEQELAQIRKDLQKSREG
ncbi:MAG: hypothetical protein WDA53_06410 [Bacillota bacterium]